MEMITIQAGDFKATISLEGLCTLPRSNYRKILRLMQNNQWENQEAISLLRSWLPAHAQEAKAAWAAASQAYASGWKQMPNKRSRTKKSLGTLRENKRLKTALKQTKAAYDQAVVLQSIYDKEFCT